MPRRVFQNIAAWLAFGFGMTSVVFAVLALFSMRVDCTTHTTNECHFAQQLAKDIAQMQGLTAVGCACVAGGLFFAVRHTKPKDRKHAE